MYVLDSMAFLVVIEKKDIKLHKDALNSNVNTDKSDKKLVGSILGIPITGKGFAPNEFFNNMLDEKKTEL